CMGCSLIIITWLFYHVTGSLFNPNMSLTLLLVGVITPVRFVLYCVVQLAGGIAVLALVQVSTPGPLSAKWTGVNKAQCSFIEEFITSGIGIDLTLFTALL
ncbi:hypothetical protein NEOLEDRAFT_1059311, partial [Neolentinus lepideus HHB14362 ss-1]